MEERQQALGFEPHTLVRKDDPITSHDAAELSKDVRERHFARIIDELDGHAYRNIRIDPPGPYGLTSEEIAAGCELQHAQVWRRMGELETAGKVIRTQETRKNHSGRKAIVWMLVG